MAEGSDSSLAASPDRRGWSVTNTYESALGYKARGWTLTPLEGKKPLLERWNERPADDSEVWEAIENGANVGVVLGEPSGNLVDVDLDCPEAVKAAPLILPSTQSRFGRPGNPNSHYLYYVDSPLCREAHKSNGKTTVELRGNGSQTRLPPSDDVVWVEDGEPARVGAQELQKAVEKLAIVCEISQQWPDGSRHDTALTLAGALKSSGWQLEQMLELVQAVCAAAGDDEVDDRLLAVHDTFASDGPTTGWPRLAELLGKQCVTSLKKRVGFIAPPMRSTFFDQDELGMYEFRLVGKNTVRSQIANFRARIVRQITHDDGWEKRRVFVIEAFVGDKRSEIEVEAADFDAMTWCTVKLGAEAMILPGRRESVRAAIQAFSRGCEEEGRYGHSGWRQFDGKWFYLHSGGAIGADGDHPEIHCQLPNSLVPIELSAQDQSSREDFLAVQRFAHVGPGQVTWPLLAAIARTSIGHCGLNLLIYGRTGSHKTTIAALGQAFYGKDFHRTRLPCSFQSTANAIEQVAHMAQDAVVVIDDYCPNNSAYDTAQAEPKLDRTCRSNTEGSGRQRSTRDGRLVEGRAPRCTVVGTAETLPSKSSLRTRAVILDQGDGGKDLVLLTRCQKDAAAGCYARLNSAYIRWLAPRLDEVRAHVAQREGEWLLKLQSGCHGRIPHLAAKLLVGMEVFVQFLSETGLATPQEVEEFATSLLAEVTKWRDEQANLVKESDPVELVFRGLRTALAAGKVHLTSKDGSRPKSKPGEAALYGWKQTESCAIDSWAPSGARVGYVEGDLLYLFPGPAIEGARSALGPDAIAVPDVRTLMSGLQRANLLVKSEATRGTTLVRKTVGGERLQCACLRLSDFVGADSAKEELA